MNVQIMMAQVNRFLLIILFVSVLALSLSCQSQNTANNENIANKENAIDKKIEGVSRSLTIATAEKVCKEQNISDKACQELKDGMIADTNAQRADFITKLNKECKDKVYSDKECSESKEKVIAELREGIDRAVPFSELEPEIRSTVLKHYDEICEFYKHSDEKCNELKNEILSAVLYKRTKTIESVADECRKRNAPAEQCKAVEIMALREFKNEILNIENNVNSPKDTKQVSRPQGNIKR